MIWTGFTGTYNNLQDNYCDKQFRSVTNTTFTMSSARRLGSSERATSSQNRKLLVTYRYVSVPSLEGTVVGYMLVEATNTINVSGPM